MLGDKMLIYDRNAGMFFAGWKKRNNKIVEPLWSAKAKGGFVTNRLGTAYDLKEQLGLGVRIVSETEANKIDALREYREKQNEQNGNDV